MQIYLIFGGSTGGLAARMEFHDLLATPDPPFALYFNHFNTNFVGILVALSVGCMTNDKMMRQG